MHDRPDRDRAIDLVVNERARTPSRRELGDRPCPLNASGVPERVQQQDRQRPEVGDDQPGQRRRPAAARAAARGRACSQAATVGAADGRVGTAARRSSSGHRWHGAPRESGLPAGSPLLELARPMAQPPRDASSTPRPSRPSPCRSSPRPSSLQSLAACSSTGPSRSTPRRSRGSARSGRATIFSASSHACGLVGASPNQTVAWRVGLGRHHVVHPQVHAVRDAWPPSTRSSRCPTSRSSPRRAGWPSTGASSSAEAG